MRDAYTARSAQAPTRDILVDALSYLTSLRLRIGRDAAVDELLDEVLSLDPWNVYATRTAGVLAARRGDWGLAKYHFGAFVLAEPDSADAAHLYGRAHLEMNQLDGAIEQLRRSVELDAGVAQVHRTLGVAYERAGRRDEAVSSYERYLEFPLDPAAVAEIRAAIARLRDGEVAFSTTPSPTRGVNIS